MKKITIRLDDSLNMTQQELYKVSHIAVNCAWEYEGKRLYDGSIKVLVGRTADMEEEFYYLAYAKSPKEQGAIFNLAGVNK